MLPGSPLKTKAFKAKFYLRNSNKEFSFAEGDFILSHWELSFSSNSGALEVSETYNCISSVEKKKEGNNFFIEIFFKNFKHWIVSLAGENEMNDWNTFFPQYKSLKGEGILANVPALSQILPFDIEEDGWKTYNPYIELERLFVRVDDKNNRWRISEINQNYEVCESYPSLLALPREFNESLLKEAADHRDESRFPALSWVHPSNFAVIARCSQPLPGRMGNIRSEEDEKLIKEIFRANFKQPTSNNYIMDARPFSNAVANRYKGAGYEQTEFYQDCQIEFMGIENIHTMRISAEKIRRLGRTIISSDTASTWLNRLEATGWLGHLQLCLKAAVRIAKLVNNGSSVVIHCSHGWDRTAQLASIAQLLLDPHYRTIRGFEQLIEKEWISFGHRIQDRAGHLTSLSQVPTEEESPIFLQFIDCIYQLLCQFPTSFEFNDEFLIAILDGFYNCKFGTFLCNSEKERKQLQLDKKTISLWTYLNHQNNAKKYQNLLYQFSDQHFINPSTAPNQIRFWSNLYERSEWQGQANAPSLQIHNHLTALLHSETHPTRQEKMKESSRLSKQLAEKERQINFLMTQTGIKPEEIPSASDFRTLKYQKLKLEHTETTRPASTLAALETDDFVVLN